MHNHSASYGSEVDYDDDFPSHGSMAVELEMSTIGVGGEEVRKKQSRTILDSKSYLLNLVIAKHSSCTN